jgi:hypothetical protein
MLVKLDRRQNTENNNQSLDCQEPIFVEVLVSIVTTNTSTSIGSYQSQQWVPLEGSGMPPKTVAIATKT